jgi:hypothetical protein
MPLVRWILATVTAALLVPASAGAIVNGSFDGDAHPYAGIAVAGDVFCSGELVSPTVFVTAGHCTAAFADTGETTFVTFDAHARPSSEYVTGTPHTHPGFFDVPPQGVGVPASLGHDVGVVVLDTAVDLARYASLPRLGALGADRSAPFTLVGYGGDGWVTGGGRPFPTFSYDRMAAASSLIGVDGEFARFSTNLGQGGGGVGPGDSGGPALRAGTDVVSAIASHGPSPRATGNGYWYRLDTSDARSFLGQFVALP